MVDSSLFTSVHASVEQARKLRQCAREGRALAKTTMARALSLRRRVHRLDNSVAQAREPQQIKKQLSLREEALDALKQSLADLESVRMAPSDKKRLEQLKADIRETLERSR
jgi:transposase-like protein